ncbi:MAG: hypothetical protein OXC57_01750 [Rhodobacteraceae bacterium]|nr:hypothetical protein [Paracoccaceae bacterium]
MQSNDKLCRIVLYPVSFIDGIFGPEQFLTFESLDKKKSIYALSVVLKWLIRTDIAVHDYGENVAKTGNERLNQKYNYIIAMQKYF